MTERMLITGGAGFLGSHVCDRLMAEGAAVECVDNFLTGTPENVEHLLPQDRFTLVEHDITKPYEPRRAPDVVLHLASPASPHAYLANPIHTIKTGTLGTLHALGIAKRFGAALLFASTSEIYGDPEIQPQPESYHGNVSPVGPRSAYDEAKRVGEALVTAYRREHGIMTSIARIFNTYGPRMAPGDGRVVSTFIHQAMSGRPLTVHGQGTQTRSFCFVDDLVGALLLLLETRHPDPINLGSDDERTIGDLARLVVTLTGSTSDIVYSPLPEDDPQTRRPDLSTARAVLGWEPQVSLEEGLRRTIEWHKARLRTGAQRT
jgi:dTDP-glucose 4,6-dehydratase